MGKEIYIWWVKYSMGIIIGGHPGEAIKEETIVADTMSLVQIRMALRERFKSDNLVITEAQYTGEVMDLTGIDYIDLLEKKSRGHRVPNHPLQDEECHHIYGIASGNGVIAIMNGREWINKHKADDDGVILTEYAFCPKCGVRLTAQE